MKKFIFILGGVRSGKSSYAADMAKDISNDILYIATSVFEDEEMAERVRLHQESRPLDWGLIEEGHNLARAVKGADKRYGVILIDCLGVFISNLLCNNLSDEEVAEQLNQLTNEIGRSESAVIVVSNEVGCGIIPEHLLGRRFRDLIGLINQRMAKTADEVIFMQAGIPIKIKGDK